MKKRLVVISIFVIMCIGIINMYSNMNHAIADENTGEIPNYYNIRDYIDLTIKNQHQEGVCEVISSTTAIESYVKMKKLKGELNFIVDDPVFSTVVANRLDNTDINLIPISEVEEIISQYYNGSITTEDELMRQGKFDEEGLVFELQKLHSKYQLVREDGTIGSFFNLELINKEVKDNEVVCTNKKGDILSEDEVANIRNTYKRYIMENGAIHTSISTHGLALTEKESGEKIQVCNGKNGDTVNHGIVIIGWDDNFSRMNFPEGKRPKSDGAYIAQNSWGADWGNNGLFYISYEDIYVEYCMQGIYDIQPYEDTLAPKIKHTRNDNGKYSIKITDVYGSGVKESNYIWVDHNKKPSLDENGWVSFNDPNYCEIPNVNGKYLWIYTIDNAGNENYESCVCNYEYYEISYTRSQGHVFFYRKSEFISNYKDSYVTIDDLSDADYTIRKSEDGSIDIYINKIGTYNIHVYAVLEIDSIEYESVHQEASLEINEKVLRNRDKQAPKVNVTKKFDEGVFKIFVDATDDYGVDDIWLVDGDKYSDDSDENCTYEKYIIDSIKADNGKGQFQITKNGLYFVIVFDTNGNQTVKSINVDSIGNNLDSAYGDINQDGEIDVLDVIVLNKYLLGQKQLTDIQKEFADCYYDNKINSLDSLVLLKYVLGINKCVPTNQKYEEMEEQFVNYINDEFYNDYIKTANYNFSFNEIAEFIHKEIRKSAINNEETMKYTEQYVPVKDVYKNGGFGEKINASCYTKLCIYEYAIQSQNEELINYVLSDENNLYEITKNQLEDFGWVKLNYTKSDELENGDIIVYPDGSQIYIEDGVYSCESESAIKNIYLSNPVEPGEGKYIIRIEPKYSKGKTMEWNINNGILEVDGAIFANEIPWKASVNYIRHYKYKTEFNSENCENAVKSAVKSIASSTKRDTAIVTISEFGIDYSVFKKIQNVFNEYYGIDVEVIYLGLEGNGSISYKICQNID